MIDPAGRTVFAEALRGLATGRVTNDYFEDVLLPKTNTGDDAVCAIYELGAWSLYSDLHEHKLRGKYALRLEDKTHVARWILFLKASLPYEWPTRTPGETLLMTLGSIATLGWTSRRYWRWFRSQGDISVWPFKRQADYLAALGNPPYLRGNEPPSESGTS
jgi:hypothetical protein